MKALKASEKGIWRFGRSGRRSLMWAILPASAVLVFLCPPDAERYREPHANESVSGPAWRDRMESVRPAHLNHRLAAHRAWRAAGAGASWPFGATRFPADSQQPARQGSQDCRTCWVCRRVRATGRPRPRRVVLRKLRGQDQRGDLADGSGVDDLERQCAWGRIGRPGWRPARSGDRTGTWLRSRASHLLRARPRAESTDDALARARPAPGRALSAGHEHRLGVGGGSWRACPRSVECPALAEANESNSVISAGI